MSFAVSWTLPDYSDYLPIAVGAIVADNGKILLSKRAKQSHQGNLWEFPGGKIEPNESIQQALARELREELGIQVLSSRPLIRIAHSYPDGVKVLLQVWRVDEFSGQAQLLADQQEIAWVSLAELTALAFPAANQGIIKALMLAEDYLITPNVSQRQQWPGFLQKLEISLQKGIKQVQLRCPIMTDEELFALAQQAQAICQHLGVKLIVNCGANHPALTVASGWHLNSRQLANTQLAQIQSYRKQQPQAVIGASCHNAQELAQAEALGIDYVLVSPVAATSSHPEQQPIGWQQFHAACEQSSIPVYALGGMASEHKGQAKALGGQGVAAISSYWDN